jgi:predicted TPR repeat methyltransferase
LKKKYKKAIFYLEKGQSEDKIGLLKFIKEIDHISEVPSEIYSVYRGIITKDIVDKFFNKNLNLPRDLVIKLIGAIDKLPEKYSILEIGSNIGFLGEEIDKRMQEGFSITGIESSTEMVKLQKQSKRDKVYDKIINLPIENYLIDHKDEKYDIILSLDGFANNSELSDLFGKLYNSLSYGGYFAFACRISDNKGFSDQYLEFVYKEDYIHKLLNKCGFSIIDEPNSEPLIKNSYVIFVCKKLNQVKK